MTNRFAFILLTALGSLLSCQPRESHSTEAGTIITFHPGEFGYDLQFLKKQDTGLVILKDEESAVIVSPQYQAKVFTSTARGDKGYSFGWIHYKAFNDRPDTHMNAYGGENRLWLGPEGGKFSLFFPAGSNMVFENWKTPAPIDTEAWTINNKNNKQVVLSKEMNLVNYLGTHLHTVVTRTIRILERQEILRQTRLNSSDSVSMVGYRTENKLTNIGNLPWTEKTGMPCIWILDMFKPSESTVVMIPFHYQSGDEFSRTANTQYFGEIPRERVIHSDSMLLLRADGKSRGKLGITASRAKNRAGSYDALNRVLTIIDFDVDGGARYLNQEWGVTKPVFAGDAVNANNDGPLADGKQMGPFYEIESVSPAAFLKPGESITHQHTVFHFTGAENELSLISDRLLGIPLEIVTKAF